MNHRLWYSALLYAASPLIWWRLKRELPEHNRWQERLAWITPPSHEQQPEASIWVHAASVGEVMAAAPLLHRLVEDYPDRPVVVTTMTATGARQVRKLLDGQVQHYLLPIDYPGAAQRFIERIRPALAVIMETELWPNLIHACHARSIPVMIANGRLSEKSLHRYYKVAPLVHQVLAEIDLVVAKASEDAERYCQLGLPADRVEVGGSIKFDIHVDPQLPERAHELRRQLGRERPVWIAASTHDGEDEHILAAHREVRRQQPEALLILVPRHPQRFEQVRALCEEEGFRTLTRSSGEPCTSATEVYLGDTMGELLLLYGAADVAFVGGSLVPVGGHNMLEPATLGVPVLSGPERFNFQEISDQLEQASALLLVEHYQDLAERVIEILTDPARSRHMSQAARNVVEANRGALEHHLQRVAQRLRQSPVEAAEGRVS